MTAPTRFDRSAIAYWDARAPRWKVAPPLAPGAEDIALYEGEADAARAQRGAGIDALLLGVTASIAGMAWPAATRLLAVDWSAGMIAHVWPRQRPKDAWVARADWRALPLADASIDFAVGDGCYSTFDRVDGAEDLNREVRRVLRPGGRFCIRGFTRPPRPDSIEALFDALAAGRFPNLDLFRWLLAMAIQGDSPDGVSLHRVWEAWHAHVPDPQAHPARPAWSADALANLEAWRGTGSRYVFPTLAELRARAAAHFDVTVHVPPYAWGERFPRLVMRPRP